MLPHVGSSLADHRLLSKRASASGGESYPTAQPKRVMFIEFTLRTDLIMGRVPR
ncbi:hypothetical protein SAMN05192541_103102 [Bradyrhizobium arachidis]|nr:hypothetical protein SAMN05192541_103102 [Bradyrhizobium arachidis]